MGLGALIGGLLLARNKEKEEEREKEKLVQFVDLFQQLSDISSGISSPQAEQTGDIVSTTRDIINKLKQTSPELFVRNLEEINKMQNIAIERQSAPEQIEFYTKLLSDKGFISEKDAELIRGLAKTDPLKAKELLANTIATGFLTGAETQERVSAELQSLQSPEGRKLLQQKIADEVAATSAKTKAVQRILTDEIIRRRQLLETGDTQESQNQLNKSIDKLNKEITTGNKEYQQLIEDIEDSGTKDKVLTPVKIGDSSIKAGDLYFGVQERIKKGFDTNSAIEDIAAKSGIITSPENFKKLVNLYNQTVELFDENPSAEFLYKRFFTITREQEVRDARRKSLADSAKSVLGVDVSPLIKDPIILRDSGKVEKVKINEPPSEFTRKLLSIIEKFLPKKSESVEESQKPAPAKAGEETPPALRGIKESQEKLQSFTQFIPKEEIHPQVQAVIEFIDSGALKNQTGFLELPKQEQFERIRRRIEDELGRRLNESEKAELKKSLGIR